MEEKLKCAGNLLAHLLFWKTSNTRGIVKNLQNLYHEGGFL